MMDAWNNPEEDQLGPDDLILEQGSLKKGKYMTFPWTDDDTKFTGFQDNYIILPVHTETIPF